MKTRNAHHAAWDDREGTTDIDDALVVLDSSGHLIGCFQLAIPNYYPQTGKMVDKEWDGRAVMAYYNTAFASAYWGLAVIDSGKLPQYDPAIKHYTNWIDIHHKTGTLGCIEVSSSATTGGRNFDAFVLGISKTYGQPRNLRFKKDGHGYLPVGDDEAVPPKSFVVEMKRYLGCIYVLQIPQ
jgi:hypothetical protein